MCPKFRFAFFLSLVVVVCLVVSSAHAQQTLGAIVGTVTDPQGGVLPGVAVKAVEEDTHLTRTAETNAEGSYALQDLPIGKYTITFSREGFGAMRFPGIVVQANRTVTLPAQMSVGSVTEAVTVEANPLLNATDTTNGYVLDKAQIESIPLPTGSFTGVAILSPGVNAELPGGTGANSGLGNAPIWANGQRDTSNSFSLNGVDGSNLFNGKSTSQVASARVVNNTGVGNTGAGGVVQSSASVYLSIGNALPTPAPEMVEEVRVNASMYDAQQGSTSGAHIDLSTSSGTNQYHGSAYLHRGTDWLNAAPFFFKQDDNIPANMKVPQLHRYVAGGTFGGPIIKDKLFGFVAYQHMHVSDQEIGDSFLSVPQGLSNDRSASALAALSNDGWGTTLAPSDINNVALALFNSPAAPGQPGKYLIPNSSGNLPTYAHPDNAFIPGTAYFIADQAVADLDYNATAKDTVALKYYYQHDPTTAPYAYSNVPGFTQHLDAGSQVASISNTWLIKPNLSTVETLGILREKLYSKNDQLFGPGSIPTLNGVPTASINAFGSTYFPGVTIVDALGSYHPEGSPLATLNIGPGAATQGPNTGVFQNRIQPSGNALWTLGKHTVGFGGSYQYTQLNTIDRRTGTGTIATADFSQYAQGLVTNNYDFNTTTFLQGNANRYYRANQVGLYAQDKFQVMSNLTLMAGLRWDWDGGLTEKYGRIFNFDPSRYGYTPVAGEMPGDIGTTANGFIIAGNNVNGTSGVSKTTLTGRQWGFGPRVGLAYAPKKYDGKIVVRAGTGIYYDRGELFTYFSPGYAIGDVTGGPFGVNQAPPFVNAQICTALGSYYFGYIPTCDPTQPNGGSLNNPWGNTLGAPPTGKASDLTNYLPNAAAIAQGAAPVSLGTYDRANKLPYSINYTLDLQWQPLKGLAVELGYVGTVSRHQVIPVPFNQALIATPTAPVHGQQYSYGYTVLDPNTFNPINLPNGQPFLATNEGGNVDLRVPYTGYASESIDYKAAGVAAYNALTAHVEKRMSHGLYVGASYTYSHALDEQSGLGLFYNGNNPLNLRDGYASSDFDRTHVLNFNYVYRLPEFRGKNTLMGRVVDGWSVVGLTILQSGQPYSVIDYTGAVGSIYYSVFNGITNPIVPLAPGCTPQNAKTGFSGAFSAVASSGPALKATCFTVPLLSPGALNGAVPAGDTFETSFTTGQRNIFRQASQKRADMSIVKETAITERFNLKYTFDIYNLTNTTSFDIPIDNVSQNQGYNNFPVEGTTPLPTGCTSTGSQTNSSFYNCPGGLGITNKAIGSSRQIQMSLHLLF